MRIALVSDTHDRHEDVIVPPADLLLHAGDGTEWGTLEALEACFAWMARQEARERIYVPGNHDICCQDDPAQARALAAAHGVRYLVGEGAEVLGLRIWGSPTTPEAFGMAFEIARGKPIREHWAQIPAGLDILVTHGPPGGVLDVVRGGRAVGCSELRVRVEDAAPRLHVFGHVHESRGEMRLPDLRTRFVNAACAPSFSPEGEGPMRGAWVLAL